MACRRLRAVQPAFPLASQQVRIGRERIRCLSLRVTSVHTQLLTSPGINRRRVLRLPAGVLAASLAAVYSAAPAAGAATVSNPVRYVALGDSYSSGTGAGNYLVSGADCQRSANAYSRLWARANRPSSYRSVACAGATTSSVLATQLEAVRASTSLVSITVGGNDVGFGTVMTVCVLAPASACRQAVRAAERRITGQLPRQLDRVLAAITAAAPQARVVVLDYPQLYDLSRSAGCAGLTGTARTALNAAADALDSQLQAAAARHGDVFADVRQAFSSHQLCDPGSWLHPVDLFDLADSYHPTAAGHSGGYYPAFAAAATP
jgi:lysophospholipase L1-like esterase